MIYLIRKNLIIMYWRGQLVESRASSGPDFRASLQMVHQTSPPDAPSERGERGEVTEVSQTAGPGGVRQHRGGGADDNVGEPPLNTDAPLLVLLLGVGVLAAVHLQVALVGGAGGHGAAGVLLPVADILGGEPALLRETARQPSRDPWR